MIIGTTTKPETLEGNGLKEALEFFDEKVWVNFPDYGSNRLYSFKTNFLLNIQTELLHKHL